MIKDIEYRIAGGQILMDLRRAPDIERFAFAQHEETSGMVNLRIDQNDPDDARIAQAAPRLQGRVGTNLRQNVGRRIEQHPINTVGADGNRRLRTRQRPHAAIAQAGTVAAIAVPLREATTGGRTKDKYFHSPSVPALPTPALRKSAKTISCFSGDEAQANNSNQAR